LADLLVERLSGLERLAPDLTVYAPLGIGNHVDHQLVRQAVERWRGDDVIYYEDFPYVDSSQELFSPSDCTPQKVSLNHSDIRARVEAIACYRSQIDTLFDDREKMESTVRRYTQWIAGEEGWAERFWLPVLTVIPDHG
ncbi:MAG: hypothetical protein JXA42_26735, partial [Anaerolineales bacterium]|nr:hypothetical protein [Anaerolineales bacterium]